MAIPRREPSPAGAGALLALAVSLLYGFTAGFGFMPLDDLPLIVENPRLHSGLTPANVAWAFRLSSIEAGPYYMPLTWLSFMADAALGGLRPWVFHAANVLLFALTAALLLKFLLAVTGRERTSVLAAALFCLHPMRVESVAWIAERKDLLAGVFILLSLLCWMRFLETRRPSRYAAALVAFLLGLLSKPNVVVLPLLMLLSERFRACFRGEPPQRPGRLFLARAPFFAFAAAGAAFTLATRADILVDMPLRARLAVMAQAHYHYLSKTLLPRGLMLGEQASQLREIRPPFPLLVLIALAGLTIVLAAVRRRHPWALLSWLWFLAALAPTNGFLSVGVALWSDKFTYVPHMGLMLGVAVLLERWAGGTRRGRAAVGALLLLLTGATAAYAWRWRSAEAYFGHVIDSGGPVGYSRLMIATDRRARGDVDGAILALDEAVRGDPAYAPPYLLRGRLLEDKGLIPEAMRDYETNLRLDPGSTDAMVNLALLHAGSGDTGQAARLLREARAAEGAKRAKRR